LNFWQLGYNGTRTEAVLDMKLNKTSSAKETADETIGSLFQPDALLSDQYFANFRKTAFLEPAKSLMLAILEDGIRSFQENVLAQSGKKRLLFEEAENWLWSNDSAWPFSFVSICTHLGFDPSYIRRGLRNSPERKQTVTRKKQTKSLPTAKRKAA
jgi:hypothetical protein